MNQQPTSAPLSPQQLQSLSTQMKGSSPSASANATPSTSWDAFDKATNKAAPTSVPLSQRNTAGGQIMNNVSSDIQSAGSNVNDALQGTGNYAGQGSIQRGLGAASEAATGLTNVAADVIPGGKQALGAIGDVANTIINRIGDKISNSQALQDWVMKNPDAATSLSNLAKSGMSAGNVSGTILAAGGAADLGNKIAPVNVGSPSSIAQGAADLTKPNVPEVKTTPVDTIDSMVKESGQVTPQQARTSAWSDIQPKSTPSTKLAYAKAGNTTEQGLLTSGKLTPSGADSKLLDTYSQMYEDGTIKDNMSPQEKQVAVQQKAAQLNGQQKDFLASHDVAVNTTARDGSGLFDKLDATAKDSSMPFAKDAASKGAYDSAIDTFKQSLDTGKSAGATKGATTLSKIDAALTKFNATMEKFGAWGKTKTGELTDTGMARQQAIRDIHTTVRDYIANNLPKNSPWRAIRLQESNLYQIGDRLAQRSADTVGTSKVGSVIKNNPVVRAGINAAAGATGAGAAIHLIP